MSSPVPRPESYRLLVIDDNHKIHDDIRKVLLPRPRSSSALLDEALGQSSAERVPAVSPTFEIDSAYQGDEGVEQVIKANAEKRPYALAFIDMRMPPGIDGRETIKRLWQIDPDLQLVVCTAYSDYSWEEIALTTGPNARVVILRKPFDCIEVRQLAHTLTEKWRLEREAREQLLQLQSLVAQRTQELEQSHAVFQLIVEEALQQPKR